MGRWSWAAASCTRTSGPAVPKHTVIASATNDVRRMGLGRGIGWQLLIEVTWRGMTDAAESYLEAPLVYATSCQTGLDEKPQLTRSIVGFQVGQEEMQHTRIEGGVDATQCDSNQGVSADQDSTSNHACHIRADRLSGRVQDFDRPNCRYLAIEYSSASHATTLSAENRN